MVREAVEQLAQERVIKPLASGAYIPAGTSTAAGGYLLLSWQGHNMFFPEDGNDPRVAWSVTLPLLWTAIKWKYSYWPIGVGIVPEGEVVRIIERVEATFVGVVSISNGVASSPPIAISWRTIYLYPSKN